MTTTHELDEAMASCERGDHAATLDALLRAWRSTRAARVADTIERVSRTLVAGAAPVGGPSTGKGAQANFARWLEAASAKDATRLDLLLPDMMDGSGKWIRDRLEKAFTDALEQLPQGALSRLALDRASFSPSKAHRAKLEAAVARI